MEYLNGLVQDCRNSIANNALEWLQSLLSHQSVVLWGL